jgi:hypothetical protein
VAGCGGAASAAAGAAFGTAEALVAAMAVSADAEMRRKNVRFGTSEKKGTHSTLPAPLSSLLIGNGCLEKRRSSPSHRISFSQKRKSRLNFY